MDDRTLEEGQRHLEKVLEEAPTSFQSRISTLTIGLMALYIFKKNDPKGQMRLLLQAEALQNTLKQGAKEFGDLIRHLENNRKTDTPPVPSGPDVN